MFPEKTYHYIKRFLVRGKLFMLSIESQADDPTADGLATLKSMIILTLVKSMFHQ